MYLLNFFIEMLSEKSDKSTMRFLTLVCVFVALAMAWEEKPNAIEILLIAFGGKVWQKRIELNGPAK